MKNFIPPIFLLLFCTIATTTLAQDKDKLNPSISDEEATWVDPVKYYEYFGQEHAGIINKNMEYMQYAVHSEDFYTIEQKRVELIKLISQTKERIQSVPPYKGDTDMRDEMVAVLEMYERSFEIEFNQAITLKRDSKESYEAMEKYIATLSQAETRLDEASARFVKASQNFAARNSIKLIENDQNGVIKDLNKLNSYHRAIFLRYFKVSKVNAEFMEALEAKDIAKMTQKRQTLIEDCQATLKVLRAMPGFKGENEYRDSAIKLIEFFEDLAKNDFSKLIAISQKEAVSKEDADAYNAVIDKYNTQLPALTNNFNNMGNNLLRKHVPKPIETKRT